MSLLECPRLVLDFPKPHLQVSLADAFVPDEAAELREGPLAANHRAAVGLQARVDTEVRIHIMLLRETLTALGTCKWFLTLQELMNYTYCVNKQMLA